MTENDPKRDPRWTPRRPKIDIKIDMIFDANPREARPPTAVRLSAGTPPPGTPWDVPQGPRGSGPGPTGPPSQALMRAF